MNVMESFACRTKLNKKTRLEYLEVENWQILHLEEPVLLVRFAALLMQSIWSGESTGSVYSHGQTAHYGRMPPSIFRNAAPGTVERLRAAEMALAKTVREAFHQKRFLRPDLPALLQHYGLKTTWLDVVDNLWISVWFATHQFVPHDVERKVRVAGSTSEYRWIYFVRTGTMGGNSLRVVDLRRQHHSFSVRPHVQHGVSVHAPNLVDLSDFVLATVRFPNDHKWTLEGHMFDPGVLFPPRRLDDTLNRLADPKLKLATDIVEQKYGLMPGALGNVSEILGAAS
jgi:hypothetical protein